MDTVYALKDLINRLALEFSIVELIAALLMTFGILSRIKRSRGRGRWMQQKPMTLVLWWTLVVLPLVSGLVYLLHVPHYLSIILFTAGTWQIIFMSYPCGIPSCNKVGKYAWLRKSLLIVMAVIFYALTVVFFLLDRAIDRLVTP